jgi:hypothetical protein
MSNAVLTWFMTAQKAGEKDDFSGSVEDALKGRCRHFISRKKPVFIKEIGLCAGVGRPQGRRGCMYKGRKK